MMPLQPVDHALQKMKASAARRRQSGDAVTPGEQRRARERVEGTRMRGSDRSGPALQLGGVGMLVDGVEVFVVEKRAAKLQATSGYYLLLPKILDSWGQCAHSQWHVWRKMKIVEMKQELKNQGKKISGNKDELLQRLGVPE